jgi:pseudouridine-5'-phosphate glycosidase
VTAIELGEEVRAAFADGRPVVALESSVIAQGLPAPWNLESALRCEGIIRKRGAAPATVAMLDGRLRIGLAEAEIESLADPDRSVRKLGSRDLGIAAASGADGATTVAGTLRAAALAGIRFLATGGIGGVHRGQLDDVSSDLFELTRSQVAVFCAGVKMVLDVPATLERLESLAVPVLGYRCDEFPAFYSRHSGCAVPGRADSPVQVALALASAWAFGSQGAVIAIPPPEELLGAAGIVEQAIAEIGPLSGPEATPALLGRVAELSAGRAVEVNVALLANNAAVAADCAVAWDTETRGTSSTGTSG